MIVALPIPLEALEDCGAILGRRGAGKSATRTLFLEHELDRGRRCCLIDPKGDSWGIRLDPDGSPSRFQSVRIFGGSHADMALDHSMGEALGRLVATHDLSCIIDLSSLSIAGMRSFMRDFAEALFDHNSEPLTLFVDEADQLAPQKLPADMTVLLHRMERLIRQGRQRGIFMWMLTQRPQVLNKNLLSQAEALVAMKMTTPHDRKAIRDWMEAHDPERAKEVMDTLAKLAVGEAWAWVPPADFLERVQFPLFSTFDSMRTPKHGERVERVSLPPIDMSEIAAALGAAANEDVDPAQAKPPATLGKLEARIRTLEGELAEERAIRTALHRQRDFFIYRLQSIAGLSFVSVAMQDLIGGRPSPPVVYQGDQVPEKKHAGGDSGQGNFPPGPPQKAGGGEARAKGRSLIGGTGGGASPTSSPEKAAAAGEAGPLTGAQRELLRALAWWTGMGHPAPTRPQLAAKAGWKPGGSHLRNRLSELTSKGLVVSPTAGSVSLTDEGAAAAPDPDLDESLVASIRKTLTGAQASVFDLLLADRRTWSRAELATKLGWDAGGSHLRNRLSELSSLAIVEYPKRGEVRLQDWVQGSSR